MTDEQLVKYVRDFRRGVLGGRKSNNFCFAVCWPLEALLKLECKVTAVVVTTNLCAEPAVAVSSHAWLQLPDGRALDPTIDQFDTKERKFPEVYLGEPIRGIHFTKRDY